MSISELFIKRPIATTLVMLAICLFGIMAYRLLPISDLPNIDRPVLNVSASLPGANPETMAASVATPLERQFSQIAGLASMNSVSSLGNTQITLEFELTRDIDAAAQDVQAAISKTLGQLPRDMPNPPTYSKNNPSDQPVLYMNVRSSTLPLSTVNEYADTLIAQRLSMVSGVAQVQIRGAQKFAVRIQLDPKALAQRQLGIDEVMTAVQQANVNMPTGSLEGTQRAYTLETNGQLTNAKAYRPVIVAYRDGQPVRLGELGRIYNSVENEKSASWRNDDRTITLMVVRQPGSNTVQVVDDIKTLLGNIKRELPASVNLDVMFDRSTSIRHSVEDVKFTLWLTIGLVILVIFIFLRSFSATIIPSLALPMSIIGAFTVMYLLDFSLNNLSLMALTLSVGFVVDDAIVMLENIVRHVEHGESRMQAALRGSREIGFTILSMTISLAAVFIPVLFMGGMIGRLMREFAVTISLAILISGFVSLTLTPMLCSRFLRATGHQRHGHIYGFFEALFNGMYRVYEWTLGLVMRFHFLTFLLSLGVLWATINLFKTMPISFLPNEDMDRVIASTEAQQGISFAAMVEKQKLVTDILRQDPNINVLNPSVSGGQDGSSNNGSVFIMLKPRAERPKLGKLEIPVNLGFWRHTFSWPRPLSADELIQVFRAKVAGIPGIRVIFRNIPPINVGGQRTRSMYQYSMQSPNFQDLYKYTPQLVTRLSEVPGFQDVNSDLQIRNPQVEVDINREKASALGVTVRQIEDALYSAYGTRFISNIYAPNNTYRVYMELADEYQADLNALSLLYIRSSSGALVPLSTVATLKRSAGPLQVTHLGQLPSTTVSFNLAPGISLNEAVSAVEEAARTTLPPTITGSFQGTAQIFTSSLQGMGVLLIVSILVIYIVLGVLYESFIHPLTILSGLPSAGFGALVTLLLFGSELNLYSFVGIIMLIGIVKKNAIMMIDFALEAQRNEGKSPREAILEGCLIRFRPIMMTTMAALMGTLPIALGMGAGAESRRPLGLAVVGGLLFSQVLTLYITPIYYIYLEKLRQLFVRDKAPAEPDEEPAEA